MILKAAFGKGPFENRVSDKFGGAGGHRGFDKNQTIWINAGRDNA